MNDRYISEDNSVYETDRKYYTMIPNMIFDIGFSIQTIMLYCELKRIAGEKGKCWMSTANLAKKCDMSTGSVSESKRDLVENSFIKIKKIKCDKGFYHEIEIVDVWLRNITFFTSSSPHEELTFSPHEKVRSLGETKNNTIKNNPVIAKNNLQKELHKDIPVQPISTAIGKNGDSMNKEEIMRNNELALMKGLISNKSDYAQFMEDVRPWVQRVCELWKLRPPVGRSKNFWITGARELEDACGEFGVDLLDEVYADWKSEFQGPLAPFRVGNPNSLVKTARGKAGMKRQGISGVIKQGKPEHQSRLDV
ncbi:MAG: helix-turn-helix domain-containing protein [Methanotrichaceae archaeon]|nr:helix-turn-helix domain-containing protein [Methanotrichaceae archaeon]